MNGPLRVLWTGLALQWRAARVRTAINLGLTLVAGALTPAVAWVTKHLIDEVSRGAALDRTRALQLALAVAVLGGAIAVIGFVIGYLDRVLRARLSLHVETTLFEVVNRQPGLAPFEDPAFHNKLRLAVDAARDAPQHVAELAQMVVRVTATLVGMSAVVLAISPVIAVLYAAVVAVSLGAQLARTRREAAVVEAMTQTHRWHDWYRALLTDVKAAKELRLYGLTQLMLGRMTDAYGSATRRQLAVERTSMVWQVGLTTAVVAVTAAGVAIVVGRVAAGELGVGDVALFLAAVGGLQAALGQLLYSLDALGPTLMLLGHYLDVLALPAPSAPGRAVDALDTLELRDVWFRYHPEAPWVLRGVSLRLARGEALALVGLNGSGKSTLVKLVCGFYAAERGAILWNGVDLRELDPAALRRRLAVVFQDFMTYDLTAAENIGLGDVDRLADLPRIRDAAARAGIDAALAALPEGYATLLSRVHGGASEGDDDDEDGAAIGASLSGGQWQRVAVARALMRDRADLLVLDEPSAGLDPEAEADLHAALAAHARGRTRLLISHRLGALRDADRIAVLAGGEIAELGTHAALIARDGAYARLFALQARGYREAA